MDNSLQTSPLKEKTSSVSSSRKMLDQMLEPMRTGWKIWKRIGRFMGDVVGRAFLTLFYFTVFVPFALGVRLLGDPLALRPRDRSDWLERKTQDLTIKDSRRLS